MSDFLLQKSCKLLLESKHIKKTKKSEKRRLKKKKNYLSLKELEEKEFQNNTLRNLKKFEQLSKKCAVDISEEVVNKCCNKKEKDLDKVEEEEATVFTEKDFEDFEKEYCDS